MPTVPRGVPGWQGRQRGLHHPSCWRPGGDDGNAGSVAVNSNSAITVNGTGTGIPAVSIGGAFGLFASAASAGGDGGNGADVTVMLASESSIVTHGAGARRLCAERRRQWWIRGSGGPGGDAGPVIINRTSNINSLGDATIVIHHHWRRHGDGHISRSRSAAVAAAPSRRRAGAPTIFRSPSAARRRRQRRLWRGSGAGRGNRIGRTRWCYRCRRHGEHGNCRQHDPVLASRSPLQQWW